jgi:hypothetical protein
MENHVLYLPRALQLKNGVNVETITTVRVIDNLDSQIKFSQTIAVLLLM